MVTKERSLAGSIQENSQQQDQHLGERPDTTTRSHLQSVCTESGHDVYSGQTPRKAMLVPGWRSSCVALEWPAPAQGPVSRMMTYRSSVLISR